MRSKLFRRTAAGAMAALAAFCFVSKAAAQVRLSADPGPANVQVMTWRDIPFRTVVRQQHDYSCGSAAVATPERSRTACASMLSVTTTPRKRILWRSRKRSSTPDCDAMRPRS